MQGLARKATIFAAIAAIMMIASVLLVPGANITGASSTSATPASIVTNQLPTPTTSSQATPGYNGPVSPHPGTLDVYEVAPGGATTEDPAVAYDTVSYEPILNVYETLIAYNGTSTGNFVPVLATCVPGTSECLQQFGSTLIQYNPTTGFPAYLTFVIDPNAHFYDPSTKASWGVYPSDVMYSFARTMNFANLPASGVYNGWILSQALLPTKGVNPSWDGGIHAPYNNTPGWILSSMLVNDSAYCPAIAMTQDHGCITLDVGQGGTTNWPFIMQLLADNLGASVIPCGWGTYEGATVPGFYGTTAAKGDGPCLLPGNATSTSQASFQAYLSQMQSNPTAWDSVQQLAAAGNYAPNPNLQWNMVGSGPYYSAGTINPAVGYFLQANPAYNAPTGCAGQPGCFPLPGTYQKVVNVYWEDSDVNGITEYKAGQADMAGIELPADIAAFNSLVSSGKIKYTNIATISIFFQPINLNFNVQAANNISGAAGTTNVKGNFFSNLGLRQFLINAVPYATVNSTLLQLQGGISIGFGYGGAIPKGLMGGYNYYSYNVSWPQSDPLNTPTVVGTAAWWWAQVNNPNSSWYDPALAACTASSPCTFPLIGEQGDTFHDGEIQDMIGEIKQLTGDRLQPYTFDLTFTNLITYCASGGPSGPGQSTNPCPLWNLGWAPDYPDPSDYVKPMYLPNETYTYADSVAQVLMQPQYNLASCPYVNNYTAAGSAWPALVYYHNLAALPEGCQGVAYNISNYWFTYALHLSLSPYRALVYQMANSLEYLLGLYVWNFQEVSPASYAPWILGSSINSNIVIGGGGDSTWYTIAYANSQATATFNETGLASGTTWSVTIGGNTYSSSSSSIAVPLSNLVTTSYNYGIGYVSGYTVTPATGSVNISAGNVYVNVDYTVAVNLAPLTLSANGLVLSAGQTWSVMLTVAASTSGPGLVVTSAQAVTVMVPVGSYNFVASTAVGYVATNASGALTIGSSGLTQAINYAPKGVYSFGITFTETGLIPGTAWTVMFNGVPQTTTATSVTYYAFNGTYQYSISSSGYVATPGGGTMVVSGGSSGQGAIVNTTAVTFSFAGFEATYQPSGLPATAASWSVMVNGVLYTAGAHNPIIFGTLNTSRTAQYTYVVMPPSGFTANPAYGVFNFSQGNVLTVVTFTPTTGTLRLTGLPSGYALYIGGTLVVSGGTNSTYVQSNLPVGPVSVEILVNGYAPYFNNVTIAGGQTTPLAVSMVSTSSSSSPAWTYLSTLAYIVIAVLVVLVIIFIATTFMARGRRPPANPPESWKSSESTTTTSSSEAPK
ncbi:MAG: hypothetical protein QXG65_04310 [Thermoplasmata archaeon]